MPDAQWPISHVDLSIVTVAASLMLSLSAIYSMAFVVCTFQQVS